MSSLAIIRLISSRELRDRLGNKAFIVTTLLILLIIVGMIVIPSFFDDDQPPKFEVGVIEAAQLPDGFDDALAAVAASQQVNVDVATITDRDTADEAVVTGEAHAVVLDDQTVLAQGSLDRQLRGIIEQALASSELQAALGDAGVDPSQVSDILGGTEVAVVSPDGRTEASTESAFGLGFMVTVLLFLILQFNGTALLTTTVEEKSSRVVEVLLGTVRPWQLLAGKLVAMTILSVGQLLLYAGIAFAAASLVGSVPIPEASPMVVVTSIVMFLFGFALWAAIYAVAGSLASSAEEAQSSAGPIGFLAAAVYMAVLIGVVPNPDGTLARVLTFLPPTAPFAVPARAASGLPLWEFLVAATITAIGSWLVVRLAGRLYSAAVLSGGRLTWRAAFRAEPIR